MRAVWLPVVGSFLVCCCTLIGLAFNHFSRVVSALSSTQIFQPIGGGDVGPVGHF